MSDPANQENAKPLPWPAFGEAWSDSEIWTPSSRGIRRSSVLRPTDGSLNGIGDRWPSGAGRVLDPGRLPALWEILSSEAAMAGLRRVFGVPRGEPVPGWLTWRRMFLEGLPATVAPEHSSAWLVANDWRQGFAGIWTPVLRSLLGGHPMVLMVDACLPELFDDLHRALEELGVDWGHVCALVGGRADLVPTLLNQGRWRAVRAAGPASERETWTDWVADAPEQDVAGMALPFGFGVGSHATRLPLQFTELRKRQVHKEEGGDVPAWVAAHLAETFGMEGAWGGWRQRSLGSWVIPPREFSRVTELVLAALEDPDDPPSGLPILDPDYKKQALALRQMALGQGATPLLTPSGSHGGSGGATMGGPVFTNVELETAQVLASWPLPSLALCRGELDPNL